MIVNTDQTKTKKPTSPQRPIKIEYIGQVKISYRLLLIPFIPALLLFAYIYCRHDQETEEQDA